jgi:hypothetical protein
MESEFFFVEIDKDGTPFYVIPVGSTLYRGDSSAYDDSNQYQLENTGPVFFGFDKDNIEKNYGITYQFNTKREMRCIAIDLLNADSSFYKKSHKNIKKILKENYGILSRKRLSESVNDKKLVKYICEELKLDGYATNSMETEFDTFHAEIAICNIGNINPIGTLVTDKKRIKGLIENYILTMITKKEKEQRQEKKRRQHSPGLMSPIKKGSLFDSPSSPYSPQAMPRSLFASSPYSPPSGLHSSVLFPRTPSPASRKKRGGKNKRKGGTRRTPSRI